MREREEVWPHSSQCRCNAPVVFYYNSFAGDGVLCLSTPTESPLLSARLANINVGGVVNAAGSLLNLQSQRNANSDDGGSADLGLIGLAVM